jgi:hypothetical protein
MPAGNFLTFSGGTIPSSLNPLSLRVCIASIFVIVVVLMAAAARHPRTNRPVRLMRSREILSKQYANP